MGRCCRGDSGRLPEGIDGLKVYHIENYYDIDALQDGRKWKKNCPTEWKDHGRTRYADCCGSFKCTRERCPFKTQYGVINTTQFESKDGGTQVCKGCGLEGIFVPCYARRYLCYKGKGVRGQNNDFQTFLDFEKTRALWDLLIVFSKITH